MYTGRSSRCIYKVHAAVKRKQAPRRESAQTAHVNGSALAKSNAPVRAQKMRECIRCAPSAQFAGASERESSPRDAAAARLTRGTRRVFAPAKILRANFFILRQEQKIGPERTNRSGRAATRPLDAHERFGGARSARRAPLVFGSHACSLLRGDINCARRIQSSSQNCPTWPPRALSPTSTQSLRFVSRQTRRPRLTLPHPRRRIRPLLRYRRRNSRHRRRRSPALRTRRHPLLRRLRRAHHWHRRPSRRTRQTL